MIDIIDESRVYEALPPRGFLREYVIYASRRTDANAAFHLGAGLAVLAQSAPIGLSIQYGGRMYSNIYVLLVGSSTQSRKSAALKIAQEVLQCVMPEQLGETPGSHEGLAEQIRLNPKLLFCWEEFGKFLSDTQRGYLSALKMSFTSLYDCSPFGRTLAKQQRGRVEHPRVSLAGGVAPELLEAHSCPEDWTGGFLARFLTIASERQRTYEPAPTYTPGLEAVTDLLRERFAEEANLGPCVGLDEHAIELWRGWAAQTEHRVKQAPPTETKAAIARAGGMVLKIALLLGWDLGSARQREAWRIGEEELTSAIRIVNFHIDSVLLIGEGLAATKDMRDRRAVLVNVGATPTPLGVIIRRSKLLKPRVQQIIETLLEEGTIRQVVVPGRGLHYALPMLEEERATPGAKVINIFRNAKVMPPPVETEAEDAGDADQ